MRSAARVLVIIVLFSLAAVSALTQPYSSTFSSSGAITIPSTGGAALSGSASPFPSAVSVAGLKGVIQTASVTINGLTHTFPPDLDIYLVGPGGHSVVLFSDVGNKNTAASAFTLNIADVNAAAPCNPALTAGSYAPTNCDDGVNGGGESFPVGAAATLASLNGLTSTSVNGSWGLYVTDDLTNTGQLVSTPGAISDWSLTLGMSLPPNTAPVANPDTYSTPVNTQLVVTAGLGVLVNDTDVDGDTIRAIKVTDPTHGTITLNLNGSFTYDPDLNYNGPDSFTYKANDLTVDGNTTTVTINVGGANTAPVGVNDSYNTTPGVAINQAAPGVLANDTDAESNPLTAILVTGPTNGTLTLNANGSFLYTPGGGFLTGSDSFTYKPNDGTVDGNTATVTINMQNVAPVAVNDSYGTTPGVAINQAAPGVLANDTDANGNAITAIQVTGPTRGTLTLNADGSFLYTPGGAFLSGSDSFTYKPNDGTVDGNTATVTISMANTAPVGVNDSYSTTPGVAINQAAPGVLANDTDADGNALTAILVTGPARGTLTLNANGSFLYTPGGAFLTGSDSFTYKPNDGTVDGNNATVTINMQNVAPVAVSDSYNTTPGVAINQAAPGVLANDTDANGDSLTAIQVTGPTRGTLTLNANGSFVYTPGVTFLTGSDSFTYKVNDGTVDGNTVTVTINMQNVAPVAVNDSYSTTIGVAINQAAPGVLANDTDANGNALTAIQVTGPTRGTLTLNANGSFLYTPGGAFLSGSDSFTYKPNDGTVDGNTVTVTINMQNVAPVAVNDSYSTTPGVAINQAAPGVLANDTDANGDSLTAIQVTGPTRGTLTLNANGSFLYTPGGAFLTGSDSFTYKVNDGTVDGNTATVTINMLNVAPVAVNDSYGTTPGVAINQAAPGVLANDTDANGNALTAIQVTGPTRGTLTLNANGSFLYTPGGAFLTGSDTFTYRANDGTIDGNIATVTINMQNVAPVAVNDSYNTTPGVAINQAAPGVLANDTDANGNALTAIQVTGPTRGTLTLNADGSFLYTPGAAFLTGSDSFTYKVNDGTVDGSTATVTINVQNVAPVAVNDTFSTTPGAALFRPAPAVLANDTDANGDTLVAAVVTGPANGTVTLNSDGSFLYTPAAGFVTGSDSFTYVARDPSNATSNTATVTINMISPVLSATLTAERQEICSGDSTNLIVNLNGVAPWVISWTDGSIQNITSSPARRTVSPTTTTTYEALVTDTVNQVGVRVMTTITVNPRPAVPVITGPSSIDGGAGFTLTTDAVPPLQWFRNGVILGGETASTFTRASSTPADAGVYTVVAGTAPCTATSAPFVLTVGQVGIIPIAGATPGSFGSLFRTSLQLHNPGTTPLLGTLLFRPQGAAARLIDSTLDFSLNPQQTQNFADLNALTGDSAIGTLDIISSSGGLPIAVARVFNDAGDNGTTGLSERQMLPSEALRAGDRAVLIAPNDPLNFRFNIGIRSLASGAAITFTVRNRDGVERKTTPVTVGPSSFIQVPASALLGVELGASDSMTAEITAGSAILYGSTTDNRTNDPSLQLAPRVANASGELREIIAVAGSVDGAFGSRFRTALQIYNPGDETMNVRMVFHPAGTIGASTDPTASFSVAPKSTQAFDDLLLPLGATGIGSIDLFSTGTTRGVSVTRVYNDAGAAGQTGMTVEAIPTADALVAGKSGILVASANPASFRYNIGVRSLTEGAVMSVTVRNAAGDELKTLKLTYAADYFEQRSANELLGLTLAGNESIRFTVESGAAIVYGSSTDNRTQDPSLQFATR